MIARLGTADGRLWNDRGIEQDKPDPKIVSPQQAPLSLQDRRVTAKKPPPGLNGEGFPLHL